MQFMDGCKMTVIYIVISSRWTKTDRFQRVYTERMRNFDDDNCSLRNSIRSLLNLPYSLFKQGWLQAFYPDRPIPLGNRPPSTPKATFNP
jgi:hypothetical protein